MNFLSNERLDGLGKFGVQIKTIISENEQLKSQLSGGSADIKAVEALHKEEMKVVEARHQDQINTCKGEIAVKDNIINVKNMVIRNNLEELYRTKRHQATIIMIII